LPRTGPGRSQSVAHRRRSTARVKAAVPGSNPERRHETDAGASRSGHQRRLVSVANGTSSGSRKTAATARRRPSSGTSICSARVRRHPPTSICRNSASTTTSRAPTASGSA